MEQRSDKHGPRVDDAMQREVESMMRSGRAGRADDWRDPEPPGDDQPEVDAAPETTLVGGLPDGLTAEDVQTRSELAGYLGTSAYPITADEVRQRLVDGGAPDRLLRVVEKLPAEDTYEHLNELTHALGLGHEEQRF